MVDGTIPGDLARDEHLRIDREREDAERIMLTAEVIARHIDRTLRKALDLIGRCEEVYRRGGPTDYAAPG